tara:strand:- start:1300 stop:1509 length:210 start_codon:yes stop_codon:yes gene_type:complete
MKNKDVNEQIKKLKSEILRLQDENDSLWFLLEELERSNLSNPEYYQNFEEAFKELKKSIMMTSTKIGKA